MGDQIVSLVLNAFNSRNKAYRIIIALFLQRFLRHNLVGVQIKWKKQFYISLLKDLRTQILCNKLVWRGESYRTDMKFHDNPCTQVLHTKHCV